MIKPPKQKEEMDDFDERVAAVQLQMEPSWNRYRSMAQTMIDHDFLPPIPTDKEFNKQWQIDELALRLEFCKAEEISEIYANKLNKIQNSYTIPARVHSNYFKKIHRRAKFQILESSNTICKLRCRLEPTDDWVPVTFDIIDAQDQKLLDKKNKNWLGNGVQNMLAKNCRHKAELILDPSILGEPTMEENLLEIPAEEEPSTQQIEEESKTQIVSFSKPIEPSQIQTEEVFEVLQEDLNELTEAFEIVESPSEAVIETNDKQIESNTKPFTPEEIQTIRDQKISELPPSKDAPIEMMEPIDMLAREEILAPMDPQPIEEKVLDPVVEDPKDPEIKEEELRKPFAMEQLTINDPKYHTQAIYDIVGDDWFAAFTKGNSKSALWVDENLTIYRSVITKFYPDAEKSPLATIEAEYKKLLEGVNESEKLIVCYHDALFHIDNFPFNILDVAYLEKMLFIIEIMKTFKPIKTEKDEIKAEFFDWFTKKNQGNSKESLWGYNYMVARGLI